MAGQEFGLAFILNQLQENLARQEDKLSEHLQVTAAQGATLESMADSVEHLTQIVSTGNGQPALLVQVNDVKREVRHMNETLVDLERQVSEVAKDVRAISDQLGERFTPAQKAEKWKAAGLIISSGVSLITSLAVALGLQF